MGVPVAKRQHTIQEYLNAEAVAEQKHEFHNGEILAMSGGTYEHSLIILNFGGELRSRLKGGPCGALEGNMRIRPGSSAQYVYPDLSVVCGEPRFDPEDAGRTTITNPTVVIEVLSSSTEAYDRGEKFTLYRESPTLQEYVLVSQTRPAVETYLRQPDGTWSLASYAGAGSAVRLRSLGVELPLDEIYARVVFPPPTNPPGGNIESAPAGNT